MSIAEIVIRDQSTLLDTKMLQDAFITGSKVMISSLCADIRRNDSQTRATVGICVLKLASHRQSQRPQLCCLLAIQLVHHRHGCARCPRPSGRRKGPDSSLPRKQRRQRRAVSCRSGGFQAVLGVLTDHMAHWRGALLRRATPPFAAWLFTDVAARLCLRTPQTTHGLATVGLARWASMRPSAGISLTNDRAMWLVAIHRTSRKIRTLTPRLATRRLANRFAHLIALGSFALPSALGCTILDFTADCSRGKC